MDLLRVRRGAEQGNSTAGSWMSEDERFWIIQPAVAWDEPASAAWATSNFQASSCQRHWLIRSIYLDEQVIELLKENGLWEARFRTRRAALEALSLALGYDGYEVKAS